MTDKRVNNGKKTGTKNKVQGQIVNAKKKTGTIDKVVIQKNYQEITNSEFLKVKSDEKFKTWKNRTINKRILNKNVQDNQIKIAPNGKLKVYSRTLFGAKKELKLNVTTYFAERPFDYMRTYAFTMRWASVKFGVIKDDIELGYYFYNGKPFTKAEFTEACIQLSTVRGVFSRFLKNGYISNISIMSSNGKQVPTEYYFLTGEFNFVIKSVYMSLSKLAPYSLIRKDCKTEMPEELKDKLIEMNTEITEIILGKKKPEKIKINIE